MYKKTILTEEELKLETMFKRMKFRPAIPGLREFTKIIDPKREIYFAVIKKNDQSLMAKIKQFIRDPNNNNKIREDRHGFIEAILKELEEQLLKEKREEERKLIKAFRENLTKPIKKNPMFIEVEDIEDDEE